MFVEFVTRNPRFFCLKWLIFKSNKKEKCISEIKMKNLRFFENLLIFYLIRKIILKNFTQRKVSNKKTFDYFFKNYAKNSYCQNYGLNYQKSKMAFQKIISSSKCIFYLKQKRRTESNKFYPILQFDLKPKNLNLSKIKKLEIKTFKPKNYSLIFKLH
jgi:hypothetical protein